MLETGLHEGPMWAYTGILITTGLTALYTTRMVWLVFFGKARSKLHAHDATPAMRFSLGTLVLSCFSGHPDISAAGDWRCFMRLALVAIGVRLERPVGLNADIRGLFVGKPGQFGADLFGFDRIFPDERVYIGDVRLIELGHMGDHRPGCCRTLGR